MASRTAIKRLSLEYKSLQESPTPYIEARPSEENILEWYYVITGPPDTPFEGGQFLGELKFPSNYPFGPPSIRMLTPSARFEPGARLCLNMSDFHPETWNPAWNVSTILTGLLSFMCSREVATGAIQASPEKQREFAKRSVKWNINNETFQRLFGDIVERIRESVPDIDNTAYIEVVPPSTSELVAKINTQYRTATYSVAHDRSSCTNRPSAAANPAAVTVPGAEPITAAAASPAAAAPSGFPWIPVAILASAFAVFYFAVVVMK